MDRLDPAAVVDRLRPIDGRYTWCPSCWCRCMPSCCKPPADSTRLLYAVPRMYPLYPVCIRCPPYVSAVPRMYPLYPVCIRCTPYVSAVPLYIILHSFLPLLYVFFYARHF